MRILVPSGEGFSMSRKHPPILKSLLLPPSLLLEVISVISVSAMNRYRAERRRSESISSFTPNSMRHQKSFPSRIKIAPGEALRLLWCFFGGWGVNSPEKERSDFQLLAGLVGNKKRAFAYPRFALGNRTVFLLLTGLQIRSHVAARFESVEPLQRTLDVDNWAIKLRASETLDGSLQKACIPRVKRMRNHRNFVLGTSGIFGFWKSHATALLSNRQP